MAADYVRLRGEVQPHNSDAIEVAAPAHSTPARPPLRTVQAALWLFGFIRNTLSTLGQLTFHAARYCLRHPLQVLFNVFLIVTIGALGVTGSDIHRRMILSKISDQIIDRIIAASRFTRDYNSDSAREFLNAGAPQWAQREGVRAILYHARKAGLSIEDQAVLLATADVESGFNPMARADTTSACGLFQFVKRTGEAFGLKSDECMNPWENARAGIEHYQMLLRTKISPAIAPLGGAERVVRTFELTYYLHHDGINSSSPDNMVKAIVLDGIPPLFKFYEVLRQEEQFEQYAPTFAQEFSENMLAFVDSLAAMFRTNGTPPHAQLTPANSGALTLG